MIERYKRCCKPECERTNKEHDGRNHGACVMVEWACEEHVGEFLELQEQARMRDKHRFEIWSKALADFQEKWDKKYDMDHPELVLPPYRHSMYIDKEGNFMGPGGEAIIENGKVDF